MSLIAALSNLPETPLSKALERLASRVDWEKRTSRVGMRQTLGPTHDLLARVGSPQRAFRAVHVAGTKGKGSVCALIAAGLARAGQRVGVYASPHVERLNERMRIAGAEVTDARLAEVLEEALDAADAAASERTPGQNATWFDIATCAAFLAFAREEVEWAVVEVGLGGRLDSTNVVAPELALVTNIDLEHTAILGTTRAAIAREKGGVIKPGAAFVSGHAADDEAGAVLMQLAEEAGVRTITPALDARGFRTANLQLARAALGALIQRGVLDGDAHQLLDDPTALATRLPGRLEVLQIGATQVVLDGAHIASSLERAFEELSGAPNLVGRPVAVVSLAPDKDAKAFLKALAGRVDRAVCTSVPGARHRTPEELSLLAQQAGLEAEPISDTEGAVARAIDLAAEGQWVLVTGSLYLAGAVRQELGGGVIDRARNAQECSPSSRTSS